jgi:hypothetical protein
MIWGGDDILSTYIESVVAGHVGWNVLRLMKNSGAQTLNHALHEYCPDILIILQSVRNVSDDHALQLMCAHPGMQVILVNLENNYINVLSRYQILATRSEDLILVIEDELRLHRS